MLQDHTCSTLQELYGTKSVLANGAVRLAYSMHMLGPRRMLRQLGRKVTYYLGNRRLKGRSQRGPHIAPLTQCSWIGSLQNAYLTDYDFTCRGVAGFMREVHYPRYYYAGYKRIQHALWHMVGFQLCDLKRDDVVADIGAQAGIWTTIARKKYGSKVYDVDLEYRAGIHGNRIGADAGAIPLPAGSLSHIVSFCAFNCFEGDADIRLIREAARLLARGGKLIIVPLCIGDAHVNLYDPLLCTRSSSFDRNATRVPWNAWGNNFGRWYDRNAFESRVLANAGVFDTEICRIVHHLHPDTSVSQFYAGVFTKAR